MLAEILNPEVYGEIVAILFDWYAPTNAGGA
jgi:hypothetical protein